MKTYVEVGRKGVDEHTENTRLEIPLSKSDSAIYRSVNYRKMVALKNGYDSVEFLEMEDPHDRFKDYVEDSYVDNSELLRDTYPPGKEPENLGFFINFGKLKLKAQRSKSATDEDRPKKRKKHHQDKEKKRIKVEKHSKRLSLDSPPDPSTLVAECEPSFSSAQCLAAATNSEEEFVIETDDHLSKAERKKLKLLRKEERKIRKSLEKVKSPTEKKKKLDSNVALDKILMARMKEVKDRKTVKPSSNFMLLPALQGGLFPYF